MARVQVQACAERLAQQAALAFQRHAQARSARKQRFSVALSGGSTPQSMLSLLATPQFSGTIDWQRVEIFWSDERCVPPGDPASNYGMAERTLLSRVPVPRGNVHRMRGELEPQAGADDYCKQLYAVFERAGVQFDLLYLGLGDDGHTASLFPQSSALREREAPCVANQAPPDTAPRWRLTLTYPAINASRAVIFLVSGAKKAAILATVLAGPPDPLVLPAQGVAPASGDLTWLVDADAASALPSDRALQL